MSRNWLGLDDPVSDNLSGVVIGQLLGQVARFYLFRTYVFPRPAHLDPFRPWAGNESENGPSDAGTTGTSTSGRVPPSAPGAAGG